MSTQGNLDWTATDERAVDLVRVLAMDAVQKVGNGHPGTAMSLAPAAYLLFQRVMRHDPADPHWPGRDRFVLSCGHSSLTLYIQLYLSGYGLTLDDLKAYRSWGSLTPGHPEHGERRPHRLVILRPAQLRKGPGGAQQARDKLLRQATPDVNRERERAQHFDAAHDRCGDTDKVNRALLPI